MRKMSNSDKESNKYITTEDTFRTYKNEHNLTKAEYKLIVFTFFTLFAQDLAVTGKVYRLPRKLGTLSIRKKSLHGRGYFDYQLYKETGIKRYIQNNHSSNYVSVFK